ncbi:hypothetical protein QZH41_010800, partial [Actinostola sp. cb2023]
MIKSMAIQGNPNDDEFIKTFSISYAVLEGHWLPYTEVGAKRIFDGNSNGGTVTKQIFKNNTAARYVRIMAETWFGHVCARVQLYGCDAAPNRALGMTNGDIPNNAITASSYWADLNDILRPHDGRLHWTKNANAQCWTAKTQDINQWLQIDLSRLQFVTAIATQGRHVITQRVTSYWFSYRNDGVTWNEYKENQARKTFTGNSDSETVVRHLLTPVIYARFVRFHPMTWINYISMRVEVYSYGRISPSDLGITIESKEIPDNQITASSYYTSNHAPRMGRLNYPFGAHAWCAKDKDTNQWLKFDLGHTMLVTGIVTQSAGNGAMVWVTVYKISFSLDNSNWAFYKDDEQGSQVKYTSYSYPLLAGREERERREEREEGGEGEEEFTPLLEIIRHPSKYVICFQIGSLGSPVFANQDSPSYITVYKNQDVTLKCEAVGDTPITITWIHKGQVLQSKTSQTDLTLINVTHAQQGFYNCSATNTRATNTKILYLHVKDSFDVCSKYHSILDESRLTSTSTSYVNDDSSLNESSWYIFKDKQGFNRIPTTCVPQNRCGATAPGYMQGALPTVNEGIVKRKVCFHRNGNCCHNSVHIYVRNCYMFYVYNLKKLDLSWKARYCAEHYINGKSLNS